MKPSVVRRVVGPAVSVCRQQTAHTSFVLDARSLWTLWILACGILVSGCFVQPETDAMLGFDIAPDDRHIVFVYRKAGERRLYKANIDGSHVERLDNAAGPEPSSPAFSPDGKQLLIREPYKRGTRKYIGRLHVMDVQNGAFEPLSFGVIDNRNIQDAAFAHDGKTIYFSRFIDYGYGRPPDTNLYSMDLAGSRIQQLTHYDHNYVEELTASRDGGYLFFILHKILYEPYEHKRFFVLYNLQEPSQSLLIPVDSDVGAAALSPNNQYVVFSRPSNLFKMDIQTQETSQLTHLNTWVFNPKFLHAQNKILFLAATPWSCGAPAAPPCDVQLMETDIDGSNVRAVNVVVP